MRHHRIVQTLGCFTFMSLIIVFIHQRYDCSEPALDGARYDEQMQRLNQRKQDSRETADQLDAHISDRKETVDQLDKQLSDKKLVNQLDEHLSHHNSTLLNYNVKIQQGPMANWDEDNQSSGELQINCSCHQQLGKSGIWSVPNLPESLQNAKQDDPDLISEICQNWLLPPFTGTRNLIKPGQLHYAQGDQSEFIDNLLKQKRNGFFIESGAADGETLSNTLFFEKSRNWTGLLVEANLKSFRAILDKRRHSYMINACLSPTCRAMLIPFRLANVIGGMEDYMSNNQKMTIVNKNNSNVIPMQCFPLFSILKAMGVNHVDYFSLDIEGAELEVIRTLPLNQITVDVFSIEYQVFGDWNATKTKLAEIIEYLVLHRGYVVVKLSRGDFDIILARKSIQ